MSREPAEQAFLDHYALFGDRSSEPAWLNSLREAGIRSFEELGLPSRKLEDWRFTRLTALAETNFQPAHSISPCDANTVKTFSTIIGDAHRLVFVNSHFAPGLSRLGELPDGVHLSSLAEAIANQPDRVAKHLGQIADGKAQPFAALNLALAQDGLYLELEADVSLEQPIHVLYVQQAQQDPIALHPRNLIVAGPGSRALVIEQYVGLQAGTTFTNTQTEIALGPSARVEHVKMQEETEEAFHIAGLTARQAEGSQLVSHSVSLGARLMRFELRTELAGEGASSTLNGIYLGRHDQHVDHHTTIDHATPHTTSREVYKGILDGKAHGVFHGRIHVRPHAQKINAEQINRNLLLSDGATIDTKPQLEIYADDVRCTHGAAIGQLDEDALFYLQSRGLSLEEARALLTFAFVSEVARDLPLEGLRTFMECFVLGWIPRGHLR